jgi:hypothetical protein
MNLLSEGLRFIIHTSLRKDSTEGAEKKLVLSSGKVHLIEYVPQKAEKGLIITFTGFSVNGYRDKRMVVVNNAFRQLGYRVITPQIKEIDLLLINPKSIDEVRAVIMGIMNDSKLNPNGFRPAIFAPSFTAGIAALAIADMPGNTISSLCMLGSFCNLESSIEFVMTNDETVDDYGMHILMKNFLKYSIGAHPKLEEMVQAAIEDNGFKRAIPALPRVIAQSDTATIDLYKKLTKDGAYRREVIMDAWHKIPDSTVWKERLDLSKHAAKITCPVTIIHGKDDNVIPSSQSILLYALLKEKNKHVHLELSELLDHGDMQFRFSIIKQIASMAKAINYFLFNTKYAESSINA